MESPNICESTTFPAGPGRLEWIGIRTAHRGQVAEPREAEVIAGRGLAGDHYVPRRGGGREVTLIQFENLNEIAGSCGLPAVGPVQLRRNLAVSGVRLPGGQGDRILIGGVELEVTGPCVPCSRMDEALGTGGRRAMSGRGGVTTRILRGGQIRVGDVVTVLTRAEWERAELERSALAQGNRSHG
jgi:MOSC domain-containing protein YiiM